MGSSVDPFNAPVVSSLSVRVIVDSVFDQFMPKAAHPTCAIEHVGRIRNKLHSTLAGEWGLSLLSSPEPEALPRNTCSISVTRQKSWGTISDLLGIEPERLNGLILATVTAITTVGCLVLSRVTETACATICASLSVGMRPFARSGSAHAQPTSWGALDRVAL